MVDNSLTDLTDEIIPNNIPLSRSNFVVFIICGPIALILGSFIIYTFIKYKKYREQPYDIMVAISVADVILSLHMIFSAIYYLLPNKSIQEDSLFCRINSIFSILAWSTNYCYNSLFCFFIIYKIKYFMTSSKIPWPRVFHIMGIFLIVLIFIIESELFQGTFMRTFGKTPSGSCGFRQPENFLQVSKVFVPICIYILIAICTYIFVKPKIEVIKQYKSVTIQNQLIFFIKYICIVIVIWVVIFISWSYRLVISQEYLEWNGGFIANLIGAIGSIAYAGSSLLLIILRSEQPSIKSDLKKDFPRWIKFLDLLKKSLCRCFLIKSSNIYYSQNIFEDVCNQKQEQRVFSIINSVQLYHQQKLSQHSKSWSNIEFLFKENKTNNKDQVISISKNEKRQLQPLKQVKIQSIQQQALRKDKQSKTIQLNEKTLNQMNKLTFSKSQTNIQRSSIQRYKNIHFEKCYMKAFNPQQFEKVIQSDNIDIGQLLSIESNQDSIAKTSSTGKGGKSGEFFFSNYNHTLFMKSIPFHEQNNFVKFMKNYCEYLLDKENKQSIIGKIYGLYQFNWEDDSPVVIVLMENVQRVSIDKIIRKYDMKGSTYDRETSGKDPKNLKDLNFLNHEKQLYLNQEIQKSLLAQIIKDSEFFQSQNIIDYSIILMIVKNNKYAKKDTLQVIKMENSEQPNQLYYHIGIVDYLMRYTCIKRVERIQKKCASCFKQDPSTSPPWHYGQRFRHFCTKIIKIGINKKQLKDYDSEFTKKVTVINLKDEQENKQNNEIKKVQDVQETKKYTVINLEDEQENKQNNEIKKVKDVQETQEINYFKKYECPFEKNQQQQQENKQVIHLPVINIHKPQYRTRSDTHV